MNPCFYPATLSHLIHTVYSLKAQFSTYFIASSITELQNNYPAHQNLFTIACFPCHIFVFCCVGKKKRLCVFVCSRLYICRTLARVSREMLHTSRSCMFGLLFLFNIHYQRQETLRNKCNKGDAGCLQAILLFLPHWRWHAVNGNMLHLLGWESMASRNKERLRKRRRHDGMDDANLVPSTLLNNEAITFNGRTPSFHLMALIITSKYAATAAVHTVFTLGAFIILKLSARTVVRFPFISASARDQKYAGAGKRCVADIRSVETRDDASGKYELNDKYVKCRAPIRRNPEPQSPRLFLICPNIWWQSEPWGPDSGQKSNSKFQFSSVCLNPIL